MWEEPTLAAYLERLAGFARVVCYDKRGSGVSDPVPLASLPTIETWMDDATTVMDAAGVPCAAIVGDTEGGPMAALLAATHPERATALVLVNSFARWRRADDYPLGMPEPTTEKLVERYEQNWGMTAEILDLTGPSLANDLRFRSWFTRYQRLCMPRGAASTMYRWVTQIDVRSVLPSIRVPTLVLHRTEGRHHRLAFGRYLAEEIPGAKLVELPGADTFPFHAGDVGPLLDRVEEFLTGRVSQPVLSRQLATILFTDIVDSTRLAGELGDRRWTELVQAHDSLVRRFVQDYRGSYEGNTGDGALALFDGPARAVTCAVRLSDAARERLGLRLRAGLHTGEIERTGDTVRGVAVHLAARVLAAGADGGVLVSGTVKDLVVGSGIEFSERGVHELKGVPGRWSLFEVVGAP
ncbi:MAG: alpha/beta fold hydrolase [Thermoleophilia bacterium]|nr:alpha/beta fold hydrolase [Thermoleophilia bacterium]